MATLQRRLRIWSLSRDSVGDLTFDDPTLIEVDQGYTAITLKRVSGPAGLAFTEEPGAGIVKVAPFSVSRVAEWQLLQVHATHPRRTEDGATVTEVRGRLWDGTTEFWYTAGAWTAVSDPDVDWNTLEEVNDALGDWDPAVDLGLVFRLSTTDRRYTPRLTGFRLLFALDLPSDVDDWIYGALVAGMKNEVRPVSDVVVVADGGATIDFTAVSGTFEAPFEITGIDAVWNETDDPAHRVDLLSSYSGGVITLASAPDAGKSLLVRFAYVPMIAVTTSQDYDETDAAPSVVFDRITLEDLGEALEDDYIMNVFTDPPAGVTIPAPRRVNIVVSLTLTAPLAVDLHRVAQAVTQFLQSRRVISSPSTGERATLRIVDNFDDTAIANLSDLQTGSLVFRLENVYQYLRPARVAGLPGGENSFGVGQVAITVATDYDSEPLSDFIGGS